MLDWHGSGMGVMEMSHRGKEFISIYEQAQADLRELLAVPKNFHILFMQGGGLAENAIVPLNLSRGGTVDFVVTGAWSQKSLQEARKYCQRRTSPPPTRPTASPSLPAPATWQLSPDASYVHLCSNETIHGVEFHELPDLKALGCERAAGDRLLLPGRLARRWTGRASAWPSAARRRTSARPA